jgi:hypothetical protein
MMPVSADWLEESVAGVGGRRLVTNVIKFPDDGRLVRFGRADAAESATIIILPVVRIERYAEASLDDVEPRTRPPAHNGGRRRMRRR